MLISLTKKTVSFLVLIAFPFFYSPLDFALSLLHLTILLPSATSLKIWHYIHFLLNGDNQRLMDFVFSLGT